MTLNFTATPEELLIINQALVAYAITKHRAATSISNGLSADMDPHEARRGHEEMLRLFDTYGAATDIAERVVRLVHSEGGAA